MQHLYFLGIAGQTMSGLAIASKQAGFKVTGVDGKAYPPSTDNLDAAGIHYHTSYDPDHLEEGMVVVLGNAVPKDNVELKQAQKMKLPILSFPQLIEQLTAKQHRIVVAGTHGKTTTTTLIGWLLETGGQKPDVITGMSSDYFGGSVRLKGSSKVVIEGDEYAASALDHASKFLYYHPDTLVLTSMDYDHPDMFKNFQSMVETYRHLIDDLSKDSKILACGDVPELVSVLRESGRKFVTYGLSTDCDWQAREIEFGETTTSFEIYHQGKRQERWTMALAGEHNVLNALAALVVAEEEGVSTMDAAKGLLSFRGAVRRFELIANINDIKIIDDYAHHPSAVGATLKAARSRYPEGKLWALFKPHTYSRTSALLNEFAHSLLLADYVLLSEVDAAREEGSHKSVNVIDLAEKISSVGNVPHYVVDNNDARRMLVDNLQPGDTVVCMYVSSLKDVVRGVESDLRDKWE